MTIKKKKRQEKYLAKIKKKKSSSLKKMYLTVIKSLDIEIYFNNQKR